MICDVAPAGVLPAETPATLGLVGFASRADYTPVGAVVNMAARLCADAKHGEIVIDHALRKAAALENGLTPRGGILHRADAAPRPCGSIQS